MQEKGKIVCVVFLGIALVGLFAFSSNTVSANSMPYEAAGSIGEYDTNYYWLLNVQVSDTVLIAIAPETSSGAYSSAVFSPNLTLIEETIQEWDSHSYEFIANETGNYLLKFWTGGYVHYAFNYTVKSSHEIPDGDILQATPYSDAGSIGEYDTNYYWLLNVQANDTVLTAIAPETSSGAYSSAVFSPNLTLIEETIQEWDSHSYEFIANETGNYLLKFWTGGYVHYAFNYTVKSSHRLTSEPPLVIGTPSQNPPRDNVTPDQKVEVSVSVTGGEGGVKNVTLFYTINNGTSWEPPRQMNYNSTTGYYETTIPGQPAYTWVKFKIVAYDYAGNNATKDGTEPYCAYQVIPEFPSLIILPLFMMATLLAAIVYRKKCPIGK